MVAASRYSSGFAAVGGAILLLGAAAALVAAHAPGPQERPRFDGEYGMWVWFDRDSVVVHWLTVPGAEGRLEVDAGAGAPVVRTTPLGVAHRVGVPRPARSEFTIRYGAAHDAALSATVVSLTQPRRPAVTVRGVDSLYVVGDTHGHFDALMGGLAHAGLIDDAGHWAGGRKHLVFAGDLMDRGPDVLRLLWFVYRLEREAAQAGGRVHVVLGNHEIMVMLGDARYVHPKEVDIARTHGVSYDRMFDIRHTVLGRWLISKPGLIRMNDVVIAHGGLTPEYAELRLAGFDRTLAGYVNEDLFYLWADTTAVIRMSQAEYQQREDFFWSPRSVFWHREYIQSDTLTGQLDRALALAGARTLVVGHTPTDSIYARYDGRVIAAHTPRMGAELLLLVRDGRGHRRYRVTGPGAPVPF
jgi:hypothetical protein